MDESPPKRCPDCGARDAYRRRYETGGGWRVVYRCAECGRRA
jgi:DNA-directed RNA polymerase subunit RPC12/RpoP